MNEQQEVTNRLIPPIHIFDPDKLCDVAESLIDMDETLNGLKLLEMVPGYFRDNPTPRMQEIKATCYSRLYSTLDYCEPISRTLSITKCDTEQDERAVYPRGEAIKEWVIRKNQLGLTPHIYEIGPGDYFVIELLLKYNLKFTYSAQGLNQWSMHHMKQHYKDVWMEPDPKQVKAFICFEIIEHLQNPDDIYHYYMRSGINFDAIFISTPLYTLDWWNRPIKSWRERDHGHLRTYTPDEFRAYGRKHWPNFAWDIKKCVSGQVIIGERK